MAEKSCRSAERIRSEPIDPLHLAIGVLQAPMKVGAHGRPGCPNHRLVLGVLTGLLQQSLVLRNLDRARSWSVTPALADVRRKGGIRGTRPTRPRPQIRINVHAADRDDPEPAPGPAGHEPASSDR